MHRTHGRDYGMRDNIWFRFTPRFGVRRDPDRFRPARPGSSHRQDAVRRAGASVAGLVYHELGDTAPPGTICTTTASPMPEVTFAPAIQRHHPCPPRRVAAGTVAEALDAVFAERPRLRDYVLDERGLLRRHMAVFVDGRAVKDRLHLTDAVGKDTEIYVVQALSGG